MRCWYRPQPNQLWSLWYCLLVCLLQIYSLYLAVNKYKTYTRDQRLKNLYKPSTIHGQLNSYYHQNQDGGFGSQNPDPSTDPDQFLDTVETRDPFLTAFIALHSSVLALLPFFVACCCLKVGNLASDNERIGARFERTVGVQGVWLWRKMKSIWQHGPPAAQSVHLLMAFLTLLANVLMEGQLFKAGVFSKGMHFSFYRKYSWNNWIGIFLNLQNQQWLYYLLFIRFLTHRFHAFKKVHKISFDITCYRIFSQTIITV